VKMKWVQKLLDDKGVTALEFAIVFPFFLMMLFFLFEFAYQQIYMNLVERWAMQATLIARTAEVPSNVTEAYMRDWLTKRIPKVLYAGNSSKKVDLQAYYGDTLEEAIQLSEERRGFGNPDPDIQGKGQTVCLRISVKTGLVLGSLTSWFEDTLSARMSRTIVNCYVNWDVNYNVSSSDP